MADSQGSKNYYKCSLVYALLGTSLYAAPTAAIELELSYTLSKQVQTNNIQKPKSLFGILGDSVNDSLSTLVKISENFISHPNQKLPQLSMSNVLETGLSPSTSSSYRSILPASWPVSFHTDAAGFDLQLNASNRIVVGDIVNPHNPEKNFTVKGMHWVNRVNENSSLFFSLKKSTTDAQEVMSGFGFLYELD